MEHTVSGFTCIGITTAIPIRHRHRHTKREAHETEQTPMHPTSFNLTYPCVEEGGDDTRITIRTEEPEGGFISADILGIISQTTIAVSQVKNNIVSTCTNVM